MSAEAARLETWVFVTQSVATLTMTGPLAAWSDCVGRRVVAGCAAAGLLLHVATLGLIAKFDASPYYIIVAVTIDGLSGRWMTTVLTTSTAATAATAAATAANVTTTSATVTGLQLSHVPCDGVGVPR